MNHDQGVLKQHGVAFEPPDVMVSFPTGILTRDDARIVWEFAAEACANTARFYWLSNISNLERYAPGDQGIAVRNVMTKLVGLAVIGGNFQQRTTVSVIFRAARLLGATRKDAKLEFFDDNDAARAWVDSLREKHAETLRS